MLVTQRVISIGLTVAGMFCNNGYLCYQYASGW